MLKNPPHIFITTPESLAISLTTKKFIELFYCVEYVIIDDCWQIGRDREGKIIVDPNIYLVFCSST